MGQQLKSVGSCHYVRTSRHSTTCRPVRSRIRAGPRWRYVTCRSGGDKKESPNTKKLPSFGADRHRHTGHRPPCRPPVNKAEEERWRWWHGARISCCCSCSSYRFSTPPRGRVGQGGPHHDLKDRRGTLLCSAPLLADKTQLDRSTC
jgi:hypothetical protein